jgi:hypothetical protein
MNLQASSITSNSAAIPNQGKVNSLSAARIPGGQHSKFALNGAPMSAKTGKPSRGSVAISSTSKNEDFTVSMSLNDS